MADIVFPILHNTYRDKPWDGPRAAGQCTLVIGVPWDLINSHEAQAQKNHSQTLKRLAERGGLSLCEAVAVLQDRAYHRMADAEANAQLANIIDLFNEAGVKRFR